MMILLPTRVTANSTQPTTPDEVDTGAATIGVDIDDTSIDGVNIDDTSIDGDDIDGTNYVRTLIIKSVCINLLLLQRIVDCV